MTVSHGTQCNVQSHNLHGCIVFFSKRACRVVGWDKFFNLTECELLGTHDLLVSVSTLELVGWL